MNCKTRATNHGYECIIKNANGTFVGHGITRRNAMMLALNEAQKKCDKPQKSYTEDKDYD